ncbi:(d)CMP kinase [Thermogutta sp.]|uniref:(d)CMP kinase n=1 Tax=Thermogutta sp. TaxID=1962930 RepID=UPI0032208E62
MEPSASCYDSAAHESWEPLIVTIDGPAGAGKSTVAKKLAEKLGIRYLDTGAMYRAVALAGYREGVNWQNDEQVRRLLQSIELRVEQDRVLLNGEDVSELIRSPEITRETSRAADVPLVREFLIVQQRAIASRESLVTEGRDQGTLVFPDARVKFFLVASPEERARRRWQDFKMKGIDTSYEKVLKELLERDEQDARRPFGALKKAPDAIEISTDGLSVDQVVDILLEHIRRHVGTQSGSD